MKKQYFYLIAALATATISVSSCINDEYDPMLVHLSVEGLGSDLTNRAATRASEEDDLQNTQFISGLGIEVEAYPTGGTTTYTTATYTTTSTAGTTAGSIQLSGTMYYHPTKNIDICAYYPSTVVTTPTPTATFTVNADQTTTNVANYRSSDLMYATKLTNKAKGTTHGLTFNHAMSQIIVTLQPGNGITASDISTNVTAVTINNTIPTADLTFGADGGGVPTGVVTATANGTVGDIAIRGTLDSGSAYLSNIGIIVPQMVATGTTLFTITYNSTNYTYALPADQTFSAGSKYTYNFTLNLAGLSLESVTINDWTAGSTTPGTINL